MRRSIKRPIAAGRGSHTTAYRLADFMGGKDSHTALPTAYWISGGRADLGTTRPVLQSARA
jgi:hypothetical protein